MGSGTTSFTVNDLLPFPEYSHASGTGLPKQINLEGTQFGPHCSLVLGALDLPGWLKGHTLTVDRRGTGVSC